MENKEHQPEESKISEKSRESGISGYLEKSNRKSAEKQKESLQQTAEKRRHCSRQSKVKENGIEGFRQT